MYDIDFVHQHCLHLVLDCYKSVLNVVFGKTQKKVTSVAVVFMRIWSQNAKLRYGKSEKCVIRLGAFCSGLRPWKDSGCFCQSHRVCTEVKALPAEDRKLFLKSTSPAL